MEHWVGWSAVAGPHMRGLWWEDGAEWLLWGEKGIAEQDGRRNVVANRIVTSRTVGTFMIVQDGEDWDAACHNYIHRSLCVY